MGEVIPLWRDRREVPAPRTKTEVRDHLHAAHGQTVSARMMSADMHDLHDALHEMVSNHGHVEAS